MIAATERAGHFAFKSSSLSSCFSAYSASNHQRLGRFELLGLVKRLGLLALLSGVSFRCHRLIYLLYVATAAGESIRPSDCAHRQLPWVSHSPVTRMLNSTAPSPGMVLMIAGLNGANYWPTSKGPPLEFQVASFKVDTRKKMFVGFECKGHSR